MDDNRSGKLAKWYKIGIAAVVCLAVSPIIFMVVKGLVGLLIAAAIGISIIQLAPWFSIKLATWSLKLIGGDAKANPVETRMQVQQQTEGELNKFLEEITNFEGSLSTFKQQVTKIVAKYPQKTQGYQVQVKTMEELLAVRKRAWQEATKGLIEYKNETVEISDLWEMAKDAEKMGKIAGTLKGSDPMKEFRTRVANTSVQNKMNLAMAQLSAALMEESATAIPSLTVEHPELLEFNSMKENAYVPINR